MNFTAIFSKDYSAIEYLTEHPGYIITNSTSGTSWQFSSIRGKFFTKGEKESHFSEGLQGIFEVLDSCFAVSKASSLDTIH